MIVRPTTAQILRDCCRVLLNEVLPEVDDETTRVRIVMLEKVLQNMAVRAGNEIAWMRDETAAVESYARAVAAAVSAERLSDASERLATSPHQSLYLADVAETYCRASDLLSACLEAALASERTDLVSQGEALLQNRIAHENEVVGGWDSAGR
jgi:hypothetical protein